MSAKESKKFDGSSLFPEWRVPMAATLTQERFTGPEWLFERKFDGIRLLAYKDGDKVELFSRNQLRQNIPLVAQAIRQLPAHDLILDGEITWGREGSAYHIFDVIWIDGHDVSSLSLEERRALLANLPLMDPLRRVELITSDAPWELALQEGWEGVIAKRCGSVYEHRRSKNWLKMKCELAQEFVVGGFTDPQGQRVGFGALLIGYYEGDDLVFAGKLGTGFDTNLLLALRAKLNRLEVPDSPFTRAAGLPRVRVHWTGPEIVVQVGFIEWTGHGKLRHPRFLGIREDKLAREVVREMA